MHRRVDEAAFDGASVPGLRAECLRREDSGRVASVGRYHDGGVEVLRAWGWVDEEHCACSAVRDRDGGWHAATAGCPRFELLADGIRLFDGAGGRLDCRAGLVGAPPARGPAHHPARVDRGRFDTPWRANSSMINSKPGGQRPPPSQSG